MHRQDWSPSQYSRICSDHFKESSIQRVGRKAKLKDDAVPTRFKQFPKYLKKTTKERKAPAERSMQVSPLTDMEKPECYEPPTKRRILECVKADHTYSSTETFNSLAKKLSSCKSHINLLKKKLKCSNQKSRRLKNNIKSLKSVVKALRNKNMISSNCEERLNKGISGVPLAIIKRLISKKRGNGCKYPPELRSFALTLQFYSAKAYEFIRKTFNLCLPHQAHLRKWYGKIPAEPGFTKPAFDTIRTKVEVAKDNGQKVVCSLMLDEMSIRKHVAWDGIRYRGFVDLGDGIEDDDSLPVAKDVLVLMAVCINGSWKVPCGYFFIDGLSGCERANLISVCLQRLWDTGVQVVSVTCDCQIVEPGFSSSRRSCIVKAVVSFRRVASQNRESLFCGCTSSRKMSLRRGIELN
eukprot:gene3236-1558_t